MDIRQAILAFSQSEKIKSGVIWISQALERLQGMGDHEKKGAEAVLDMFLGLVQGELGLAKTVAAGGDWDEVQGCLDRARDMIHAGVGHEATIHLSRALSKVTNTGLEAMTELRKHNLI